MPNYAKRINTPLVKKFNAKCINTPLFETFNAKCTPSSNLNLSNP